MPSRRPACLYQRMVASTPSTTMSFNCKNNGDVSHTHVTGIPLLNISRIFHLYRHGGLHYTADDTHYNAPVRDADTFNDIYHIKAQMVLNYLCPRLQQQQQQQPHQHHNQSTGPPSATVSTEPPARSASMHNIFAFRDARTFPIMYVTPHSLGGRGANARKWHRKWRKC